MAFECRRCGNCCRVAGDVVLREADCAAIAGFLEMDVYAFTELYTRLGAYRTGLVLKEQPGGACIFLTPENACRVQSAKPLQCRNYPGSWRSNEIETVCAARTAAEAEGN